MKAATTLILFLVLILAPGCTSDLGTGHSTGPDGAMPIDYSLDGAMLLGHFPGPPDSPYVDEDHPDYLRLTGDAFVEASPLMAPVTKKLNNGASARSVDEEARTIFEASTSRSEYVQWIVRASLGSRMLHAHLASEEPDAEAIGFYTQELLDQSSPNAVLLAPALNHLQGHWSAERVAHARLQASDAALRHISLKSSEYSDTGRPAEIRDVSDANAEAARTMRLASRGR